MRRMYSQKQLEKIVDNVVEEKDITPVSGTSDGTNWTSLTVGDETHGFASGGGGSVAWNDITDKPTFATVATSGSYNDLSNKPTIPSATSDLTNDSGFITNSVSNLTNYYDKSDVDSIAENIASDIPDAVSGTNDGTNWTSLTIGNTTKAIPNGGAPANMVTTDTDLQHITGIKYFDSTNVGDGNTTLRVYNPNTTNWGGFYIDRYDRFVIHTSSGGTGGIVLDPGFSSATYSGNIYLLGNILPTDPIASRERNIGSATRKWDNLYLDGNISNGTLNVSFTDIAALVGYAKSQGWIQ